MTLARCPTLARGRYLMIRRRTSDGIRSNAALLVVGTGVLPPLLVVGIVGAAFDFPVKSDAECWSASVGLRYASFELNRRRNMVMRTKKMNAVAST